MIDSTNESESILSTPKIDPLSHQPIEDKLSQQNLKKAKLYIVDKIPEEQKLYWVALTKIGNQSISELMSPNESLKSILLDASKSGIFEKEPIMVCNTSSDITDFIYFIPIETIPSSQDTLNIWLEQLSKTIQSWKPESIGIFMPNTLFSQKSKENTLGKMVEKILDTFGPIDFYLLRGEDDYNKTLEASLDLKDYLAQKNRELYIFH